MYSGCLTALGLNALEDPWLRKAAKIGGMSQAGDHILGRKQLRKPLKSPRNTGRQL